MIITRVRIRNLYSFEDSELDLTYARRSKDNPILYEYLPTRPNFRYRRVCILSGANASGKSSLARVLVSIQNLIGHKVFIPLLISGIRDPEKRAGFDIEFTFANQESPIFYRLRVDIPSSPQIVVQDLKSLIHFHYIPIAKGDSVESCRKKMENVWNTESLDFSKYIFPNFFWRYEITNSGPEGVNAPADVVNLDLSDLDTLSRILKSFDPSIKEITTSEDKGKLTNFNIQRFCGEPSQLDLKGEVVANKDKLSMGTIEAVRLSRFTATLLDNEHSETPCTLFLDECMAYAHAELERAMLSVFITRLNKCSQFFYTTHNYDILTLGVPMHSFILLRRDERFSTEFIYPERTYKKNDRNLLNVVQNDAFHTLPDTYLLDGMQNPAEAEK